MRKSSLNALGAVRKANLGKPSAQGAKSRPGATWSEIDGVFVRGNAAKINGKANLSFLEAFSSAWSVKPKDYTLPIPVSKFKA